MPPAIHMDQLENQAGRQLLSTSVSVHAQSLSRVPLFFDPMDCSPPGSSVRGISRQEYWCGSPFPSSGDLPNPGIEPVSPAWEGGFFTAELPEKSLKCDCGSFHCSGHRNQKPVCDKPQKSFHEHRIA